MSAIASILYPFLWLSRFLSYFLFFMALFEAPRRWRRARNRTEKFIAIATPVLSAGWLAVPRLILDPLKQVFTGTDGPFSWQQMAILIWFVAFVQFRQWTDKRAVNSVAKISDPAGA